MERAHRGVGTPAQVGRRRPELTRRVFLAPLLLLMMMVPGPPMEQMFFSRAPPHTGTVDTVKSCRDKGVSCSDTCSTERARPPAQIWRP